jgi:DNA-binding transcriptional LysR family regulator
MNLRQVEIYRAVMLGGSASRAALLLGISQPAVSRAIADLEGDLGFLLFDRSRGRLVPTTEGQLFYRDVAASFAGLDRLRAAAAAIRDFGTGSLRIASLAALGTTLVPRAIRAFRLARPAASVTLQVVSSIAVRALVAEGGFDLGLAADEVDLSGVEHRPFYTLRAFCALPPQHRLAAREVIGPADLDGENFVALVPEDRARRRMEAVLAAAGVRPRIVVETPNSAVVCALVLEGVGIGLVNPAATAGFVERGLVLRPFQPPIAFAAHLLLRPDARRSRDVARFVRVLEAERAVAFDRGWSMRDGGSAAGR